MIDYLIPYYKQKGINLSNTAHGLEYRSCFVYFTELLPLQMISIRGETIYRNNAILQYLLLQYNTIWPIENINILHVAIYCNILLDIVLFVAD